MSDPLSVVGSAAGIVSLGIQVSQGLYNFISSVRGRDKDLDTASGQISNLLRTFQALHDLIPKIQSLPDPDTKIIQTFRQCIQEGDRGIKALQVLLESLQNVPANSLKGKMKNTGRLLAFGLRREDLAQMQDKVLTLTATTELALQVITSNMGISQTRELTKLGVSIDSQFSATYRRLNTLELKSDMCGKQLQVVTDTIQTTSDAVLTVIGSAKQDINDGTDAIIYKMQASVNALQNLLISQHEQTQNQLAAMKTSQRNLLQSSRQLLKTPALLQEVCDVVGHHHSKPTTRVRSRHQTLRLASCTCHLQNGWKMFSNKRWSFSSNLIAYNREFELSKHSPECTFYKPQRRQDFGFEFKIAFYQALSVLLDISLSCTTGAGGYSISTQLCYKQYMVERSQACSLIEDFMESCRSPNMPKEMEYWDKYTTQTEQKLLKLFQNGEASPYDINIRGGTLLQETIQALWLGSKNTAETGLDPRICQFIRRIVRTLMHAGVPLGEGTFAERNRDVWLPGTQEVARTIAADIAQAYDTLPLFNPTLCDAFGWVEILIENPGLVHALDLPPLMTAIVLKSKALVSSILNASPQAVFQRYYGITVLHLASSWPPGLSLLLSAGAGELIDETSDKPEPWSADERWKIDTALNFAIYFQCQEACQILLSHDAIWDHFPQRWDGIRHHVDCVRCLAEHMANRRNKLRDIARQTLSTEQLAQLEIDDEHVPDMKAFAIMQQVLETGTVIPAALAVPGDYKGIYFSGNLDIEHFPIFYQAGFCKIDNTDTDHLSSLFRARIGSLAGMGPCAFHIAVISDETLLWVKNKVQLDQPAGAKAGTIDLNASATGWHYLAGTSALSIVSGPGLHQTSICRFFDEIFGSMARDSCRCWCSPQGCLPVNMWLKGICRPQFRENSVLRNRPDRVWSIWAQVSAELVNFLTFEALEVTHTCCVFELFLVKQPCEKIVEAIMPCTEDGSEVRVEELDLGVRLGCLVKEFQSQIQNSQQSLREFIYGYWSKRMAEVCVPSHREKDILSQAGVKVDKAYQTPRRLKYLLGRDFNLEDYCEGASSSNGVGSSNGKD